MEVVHDLAECPRSGRGTVVTIGAYDGVHVGHRAVIAEVRHRADQLGCGTAVVTFDRHPATVVRPESAPKLLTDLDQKLELLAETGIDLALVLRFDEERSRESAEDFVREVLVECLEARSVVVGHDFHFGHGRRGNVALLTAMGGLLGFDVLGIRLVPCGGGHEAVSSTRIRRLLADGQVEQAAKLLGRAHEVRGVVRRGDERGRSLGYPTANLDVPPEILLPAGGIYAGWFVRADGSAHRAAISLGHRPTFYEQRERPVLEANLLDFSGDLYGERCGVRFVARLRSEERFATVEELVAQMAVDVEAARVILSSTS